MAGIVTDVTGTCGHKALTIDVDGVSATIAGFHEDDANTPLTAEEVTQFVRLGLRRLRTVKGVTLAQMLHRVVHGDEATNVKIHPFIAPGSAVTVTDIGTAYRNILPGDGIPVLVDCTAMTEFYVRFNGNLIAAGVPYRIRIIRDSDSAVFWESPSTSATGEQALNQDWIDAVTLGAAWPSWATGEVLLRAQMKGGNATADPVVRRLQLGVR